MISRPMAQQTNLTSTPRNYLAAILFAVGFTFPSATAVNFASAAFSSSSAGGNAAIDAVSDYEVSGAAIR
jgi:hypothetical protein